MNKQKAIIISLVVLLALSISYVGWDLFERYRNALVFQGYEIALRELVTQAEREECEPVSIFYDEKEVHLINIKCLEQPPSVMEEEMMLE